METLVDLKKIPGNRQISGTKNDQSPVQTRRSIKLGDRLKLENHDATYANPLNQPKKAENRKSISTGFQPNRQVGRKADEQEELVKYMSNLPSYLEKGENLQEKAFSLGVLNWRHLEKWQHTHHRVPNRSSRCSPSSTNSSSFTSTDGSSSLSSRGRSCSPRQRTQHSPLPGHVDASTVGDCSQVTESFIDSDKILQDVRADSKNSLEMQQSLLRAFQAYNKIKSNYITSECKDNNTSLRTSPGRRISQSSNTKDLTLSSQEKLAERCKPVKMQEKLQVPGNNVTESQKAEVLPIPANGTESKHASVGKPSVSGENGRRRSTAARRHSFSSGSTSTDVYQAERFSCSLAHTADTVRYSQVKSLSPTDARAGEYSPKRQNLEPNRSDILPKDPSPDKYYLGSINDMVNAREATTKARNPSPTRRFSIGIDRIAKISGSKETSAKLEPIKRNCILESDSERDKNVSCSVDSNTEASSSTNRARSSPLRRLLEPLLKPKSGNSVHFVESSQRDSSSVDRTCKMSRGQKETSTLHSVKAKLDLKNCKTVEIDDPCSKRKPGSSTIQALLQVAVKNDLPLFTFAVDNGNDVLAATLRKSKTSSKNRNSWLYTFFSIHEMKKKNGSWLNHGGKDKPHGYIPNVVAQMKVSDSLSTSNGYINPTFTREFVLFSVDVRQDNQETPDLLPSDELSAIVVEFPGKTIRSRCLDSHQCSDVHNSTDTDVKDALRKVKESSAPKKDEEEWSESSDDFRTTVILPGSAHGVPRKGEPSPLIERWKSGGICDCGGWDLGCRIRLLQTHQGRTASEVQLAAKRFKLFSQGEVSDNMPVFSLGSLKNGISSVEFDSSIKHIEAFSICLAILNCRNSADLPELNKLSEMSSSGETTLSEKQWTKFPHKSKIQMEVPASRAYAYPPLSPVGRV